MNRIIIGDCRETMRALIAEGVKVQACVTSPPYFGLRDYGHPGQLGLERAPDEYVANMVEVFRLVRDLLAEDGTLWLNLGDSYVANRGNTEEKPAHDNKSVHTTLHIRKNKIPGKPKDLIGIPWRVAFALQADGWYLRQDIIWSKPNPMPESVRDRCTKSHEYVFLLSKNERYYFDQEAIAEPVSQGTVARYFDQLDQLDQQRGSDRVPGKTNGPMKAVVNTGRLRRDESRWNEAAGKGFMPNDNHTRNKRSVWTVTTKPYSGAHFATFPPDLIEPCVLAGSPAGGIVFDPFMGSGTTAEVAQRLGRQYLGCELNPEYESLQNNRLKQPALILG